MQHNWAATASLVWAVFDGGARAADVARAHAGEIDARAARDTAVIETTTEYRASRRLLSVAQTNADIARQSLEAAQNVDRLSRKALELGNASGLEVVDAARRLRRSEITMAMREVELIAARVRANLAASVCR